MTQVAFHADMGCACCILYFGDCTRGWWWWLCENSSPRKRAGVLAFGAERAGPRGRAGAHAVPGSAPTVPALVPRRKMRELAGGPGETDGRKFRSLSGAAVSFGIKQKKTVLLVLLWRTWSSSLVLKAFPRSTISEVWTRCCRFGTVVSFRLLTHTPGNKRKHHTYIHI